ncbi:carboxypeptidase C [Dacryopinax primogenitus]|uniref:Carboxypeptidase n=1 Tax=Dacryopinax primogenitus (strain DJM 731) TaxID=1858805 RepID=M5G324_DACPD|nr:carboxypeptidase C [Dacryopinax primogenitus]EJU02625.1 carboxypeptidase C [Dacryopinax primogenitus]
MKLSLLPFLPLAFALPNQLVFPSSKTSNPLSSLPEKLHTWYENGREWVSKNGITYEFVTHPEFPEYSIRVTEPTLCDSTVQQYSGYLDISDGKHLFFWFFESRSKPSEDPLVLWLNGGPGCSSITGLLFELGPCMVSDEGKNTTFNPYSWNKNANVIFLDQPVNVGFSYSDDGTGVNTSPVAAEDVWTFLEMFVTRWKKYSEVPFHISGESYGGTYLPNLAHVIHSHNKEIAASPATFAPKQLHALNFKSILIGNGLTSPLIQFPAVAEYACDGPYPVLEKDGPECQALYSKIPTCVRLIESCYKYNNRLTCVPASIYCWSQMYGPFQNLGLNPYDVRRTCDREKDGSLCYKELTWIESFLNTEANKIELGVDTERGYQGCNNDVNRAFFSQGDSMHDTAALLPPLLEDGIRLLIYAGNADFMCNAIGNLEWVVALDNPFASEFRNQTNEPYALPSGKIVGEVRSAGGKGAGNLAYVQIYEAGHMVPYDQPEAALDMFERWISDVPLTVKEVDMEEIPFLGW